MWNWTLPGPATRLADGRPVKICPADGTAPWPVTPARAPTCFPGVVGRDQANSSRCWTTCPAGNARWPPNSPSPATRRTTRPDLRECLPCGQ
ncbi:hypothetical protein AB0O68_32615 [Streptomyces sp. NPDC087512]|uniref:hypothetical protein n=1 Tax=Streptomyces sp. NPDC087512 TaxID=3155059 RepID=UPI0034288418